MGCRDSFEAGPVHHEDVQPSIVVVIEESNTATGFFENVLFALDPAKYIDRASEPRFFHDVFEEEPWHSSWFERRFAICRMRGSLLNCLQRAG